MNSNNNDVRLVGRKSNMSLWVLIGLIALGVLGAMLWKAMDSDGDVALINASSTPAQLQDRAEDDAIDNIENIAGIYAVTDRAKLHNENVSLDGVVVSSVVSDRVFYVDQGNPNQLILVMLDRDVDDEQQLAFTPGQRLNLEGELKNTSEEDMEVGDNYTATEVTAATNQRMFLHASSAEVQ